MFPDSASSCGWKAQAVFWRINYIYGSTKMTKLLNHSRFPTAQSSPTFGAKITKGGYFFQMLLLSKYSECPPLQSTKSSRSSRGIFYTYNQNWSIMRRDTPHHWASKGNKHWWIGAHADTTTENQPQYFQPLGLLLPFGRKDSLEGTSNSSTGSEVLDLTYLTGVHSIA